MASRQRQRQPWTAQTYFLVSTAIMNWIVVFGWLIYHLLLWVQAHNPK